MPNCFALSHTATEGETDLVDVEYPENKYACLIILMGIIFLSSKTISYFKCLIITLDTIFPLLTCLLRRTDNFPTEQDIRAKPPTDLEEACDETHNKPRYSIM